MKRMIAMLCIGLLLPVLASAEEYALLDVKEQYSGQRWTADIETVRNETVHVDVPIALPEADKIGVLEATYVPEPANLHTDFVGPDGYQVMGEEYYHTNDGWFSIGWPHHTLGRELQKEAIKQGAKAIEADSVYARMFFGTFDLNTAYAAGNAHTAQDGWNLVQTYAERYYPDEKIELTPHCLAAQTEPGKYKRDARLPGGYQKVKEVAGFQGILKVFFDQVIDGVPLVAPTLYGEGDGGSFSAGMDYYSPYGQWVDYYMNFVLLHKTETVKENVPLCHPSQVIEAAEALIREGKLRKVYSLRLGYAPKKTAEGHFSLTPAWVIEGELFESAKAEYEVKPTIFSTNTLEDTILIFDAETGALQECHNGFPIW